MHKTAWIPKTRESRKTLTDYEQVGFSTEANLADGHAYQGLSGSQASIVDRMVDLWTNSEVQSIPDSERLYVHRYAELIGSRSLPNAACHLILPTASNSIDLVAAYLELRRSRVLLTHPTFDNLALILRRRGVYPSPVSESEVADSIRLNAKLAEADVLFLVNPNNPTGTHFDQALFEQIVEACLCNNVTLVVDASFRLFYPQTWDTYRILSDSGVSYILFEDTGKVFPTQDMKASLLTSSSDHQNVLHEIYNEIYLCMSKFTLAVLGEFFVDARKQGLSHSVHALVAQRRARVREVLGADLIDPTARDSRISVEWLTTERVGRSDNAVAAELHERGLGLLPGRSFFWNRAPGDEMGTCNIRMSLMKSQAEFELGIGILESYIEEVKR